MSTVKVRDLTVRQGGTRLIGPFSFTVPQAGAVGLCGPSGAGKSTVLRTLVGLLPSGLSATGEVRVLGSDVLELSPIQLADLRTRAVLVPQTPVVFPESILGNALFGIRHVIRADQGALSQRAESALREAGLWQEVAHRLDAPAAQLSVGQRQRLALARALALDPELILLDEPTSALDSAAAAEVEKTLMTLRDQRTLIVVSHDNGLLERLCTDQVPLGEASALPAAAPAQTPVNISSHL